MRRVLLLFLASLLLVACGVSRRAYDNEKGFWHSLERSYESELYMQDRVMLVDPQGDAFLIRQLDSIPVKLTSFLVHQSLPQSLSSQESEPFRIGTTLPIDNELRGKEVR